MKNKLLRLAMLFAIVITIFALPQICKAATYGDYTYTVSNGEVSITDFSTSVTGAIEIPSEIDGYPVTSIGSSAFYGCSSLTSITIPDSVTSIGSSAFHNCSSLKEIILPFVGSNRDANETYESVFGYIFGCSGSSSYTTICQYYSDGKSAYYYIPKSLKKVTVTDDSTIPYGAFYNCSFLTSVAIPDSVTSIGSLAFDNTALYNNSSNWINDILYINNHLIDAKNTISGNYDIKNGTVTIADSAFSGCSSLTSITIPDSVTSIGSHAFEDCTSLEKINYNAVKLSSLPSDESDIFCYAGTSGDGIEVIFGDSVEEIPQYLFYVSKSPYKPNIKTVTIGKSVTSIGDYAFNDCSSLLSITIPNSVTNIGSSAFSGCSSLEEITLPFVGSNRDANKTVDSVFGYIFGYSESSSSEAVRQYYSDGRIAYYYIPKSLKKVTVTDDSTIPYGAFCNCSFLTSVTIPDSVTGIGDYAFYNCTTLTSVTIPDSVTSIGDYAFYNCYQEQTKLHLPNSLTFIGEGAFCGWKALEEIVIPFIGSKRGISGTVDAVFGYIFGTKDDLDTSQQYMAGTYEDYTIPLTLRKVTVTDESVIPYGAFSNCSFLTDIVIEGTPSTVMANAFSGFYNLFNVTIKSKSTRFTNSNIFEGSEFPTLYGYSGSTTETYAEKYDIYFIPLDDPEGSEYQITGNAQAVEEKIVVYAKTDVSISGKNLHIALYNNSSKLIDYIIIPSSCDFSEVNVVFKDNPEAKYAKIFLWDSVTSLEPVAKAVKVDVVR